MCCSYTLPGYTDASLQRGVLLSEQEGKTDVPIMVIRDGTLLQTCLAWLCVFVELTLSQSPH